MGVAAFATPASAVKQRLRPLSPGIKMSLQTGANASAKIWAIQRSQHARSHAELARSGRKDRGIQAVPAKPVESGRLRYGLCAHGERHLELRCFIVPRP